MDATAVILPQRQVADGPETLYEYPDPTDSGLTTMRCRLKSASAPEEGTVADQDRGKLWWEIQCPVDSRVVPSDRLYVTGTDAKAGSYARLLEVVGPSGPRTWEAVRVLKGFEILPDTPSVTGA